jgi:hypothetical protein
MMTNNVQETLRIVSEELNIPQEDLMLQGLRRYLESQLHDVQADIFQIHGQYAVSTVEELDLHYQDGSIEEATSWRDMQRLDHLEYKRERLAQLLKSLS